MPKYPSMLEVLLASLAMAFAIFAPMHWGFKVPLFAFALFVITPWFKP